MPAGKVKWFSTAKRFGFISPDSKGADVFVHMSALDAAGLERLHDNTPVQYDLAEGPDGRKVAENLRLIEG
jgi:CspA family cold shock protein